MIGLNLNNLNSLKLWAKGLGFAGEAIMSFITKKEAMKEQEELIKKIAEASAEEVMKRMSAK